MSVSPQISDPPTPEEDAVKRKRSPTPIYALPDDSPMAEGIKEVGFRLRAELIRGHEPEVADQHARELRSDIAKHISEVWMPEINAKERGGEFRETIQLINTLFEIAAAVATVVVSSDAVEQSKLDALHQHSIEGLDLIGGSE